MLNMEIVEKKILINNSPFMALFGIKPEYLNLLEKRFKTAVILRGNSIILKGHREEIDIIKKILTELEYVFNRTRNLTENDIATVINLIDYDRYDTKLSASGSIIYHGIKEVVQPRNERQKNYYKKVLKNDLVFAIGPAGTGKTYLAVAMALSSLQRNEVSRIILSRPAVEAGESLGFLPGDLKEKIDPYLRPLTDALRDMLSVDKMKALMDKEIVEITPLAYMRGRTLNHSFIILDEAQNATITQMKMFLTRLGANSKAIITGDVTQIDLLNKRQSGLINAKKVLKDIDGIEFIQFNSKDVVRHKLVADIINAYDNEDKKVKDSK